MIKKILKSLACISLSILLVSGSFTVKVKAEVSYQELCEQWANHASTPWKLIDLYNTILSVGSQDLLSIGLALYNYVFSNRTSGFVDQACALDPQGQGLKGGHGRSYWQDATDSAEDDLKNGNNYNYYTTPDHTNTSNYNVVTNNNNVTNINYSYDNRTYNYTTNIENNYYNIQNNSYNFYFDQTNYLTYVNTYNNTTIIYNGDTTELYYRLPDGSDSYNLTEEEAYNGYKTSLSVSSYENTYDSADLVFLYHFDDNEYDYAYPTNTVLSFTKNSVNYVNDLNFNHAIAFNGDTDISVNKSGLYYSFRFYPLMDDSLSLSINNTFIGGSERSYNTITNYDEWFNQYLVQRTSSPLQATTYYINDNLYIIFVNGLYYAFESPEQGFNYMNSTRSYRIVDDPDDLVYISHSTYIDEQTIYNPYDLDLSAYQYQSDPDRWRFDTSKYHGSTLYDVTSYVSNRSYNYINYDYYINSGSFNLINLGMWNFISVLLDGSVYINGIDTGIDIDNSNDLHLSFTGDSVFYFDEFFGNSVNRSVIAPSRPYDSNIVYYLPEVFQNNCILIQSLISVSNWKFGGIRPSSPQLGYVYISVNEVGNITSVQQFNGIEWIGVNAGIYNEYLDMWINVIGFNIFNNNWDVQDLVYQTDNEPSNSLIKFLTTQFNRVVNAIKNIRNNSEGDQIVYDIENKYDIDAETDIDNYIQNVFDAKDDIDLTLPEFNLPSGVNLNIFSDLPLETLKLFIDNDLGVFIFLPLIIAFLGLIL